MQVDYVWYAVAPDNPDGPPTVFGDRFWESRENFYPFGPSTVPGSLRVYRGPVPGNEVTALVGTPEQWVGGFSFDDWQAGRLSQEALCIPVAPSCPRLSTQFLPFYYPYSSGWSDFGLQRWSVLNGFRKVQTVGACRWKETAVVVPGVSGLCEFELVVSAGSRPTLLLHTLGHFPALGVSWGSDDEWDGVSPVELSVVFNVGIPTAPATYLLFPTQFGWNMIPGLVMAFAGSTPPPGALECDGTDYPSTFPYTRLYGVIGNAWDTFRGAVAPGVGRFRVPDLRGLAWSGSGPASAVRFGWPVTSTHGIAEATGEEVHTLIETELAIHVHSSADGKDFLTAGISGTMTGALPGTGDNGTDSGTFQTGQAGGSQPHQNQQPTAFGMWIITM